MHDIVIPSLPPEADSRRVLLAAVAIVVVFCGIFTAWGMIAPMYGAVHAQGTITVDSHRKTVQHLDGGIIQQILVREGDKVKEGQPLLILTSEQTRSYVDLYAGQVEQELAAMARLSAERNDAGSIAFPAQLTARRSDPTVAEVMNAEEKLFRARLEAYHSQVGIMRNQIDQIREEMKGVVKQQEENARELNVLEQQIASHRELIKNQYVTKTSLLELERVYAERAGNRARLAASLAEDGERVSELELKIANLKASRIQEAADELKKSQNRRHESEERQKAPSDTLKRLVVRAPITGTIVDLKVTTIGGVIAGREPLMDIVPENDRLIVEARLAVDDITDISLGQTADVMLTAYKASTTPPVAAKVIYIGADRLTAKGPTGAEFPYYPVHLEIDRNALKKAGVVQLQPGMSANVQIRTKARTAWDYLLSPLMQRYRKALREK